MFPNPLNGGDVAISYSTGQTQTGVMGQLIDTPLPLQAEPRSVESRQEDVYSIVWYTNTVSYTYYEQKKT